MSAGLTFNRNVVVKIGENDVTSACQIDTTSNGFALTIPVKEYQDNVGEPITITYSAKVNENAVSVVSKNSAKLEYTNNPNGSTTSTPAEEVTVYSAKIVIDKYETGAEGTKLKDAKFVLYKEVDEGESKVKHYYKYADEEVSWVTDQAQATVVAPDENGAASFSGLEDGTYYLEETEAPLGYNKLAAPVKVTIEGSSTDVAKLTVTSKVENSTGSELPETGGMGTTLFYLVGGFMMMASVVLLVTKKRMSFVA